jgi:chemotaxis signal transduction protein
LIKEVISDEKSPVENDKAVTTKVVERNVLTKEEYERRKKIQEKFDREIEELRDQRIQMIVFALGKEEYAIEIDKTREVVVTPPISKMHRTPDYIPGLANIRGRVVVVINLADKFSITEAQGNDMGYTIVLKESGYNAGILVDKVPSTLIIEGKQLESSSGLMAETALDQTFIKGLIKMESRMIFFLDIQELIESDKMAVMPELKD